MSLLPCAKCDKRIPTHTTTRRRYEHALQRIPKALILVCFLVLQIVDPRVDSEAAPKFCPIGARVIRVYVTILKVTQQAPLFKSRIVSGMLERAWAQRQPTHNHQKPDEK